MINLDEKIPNTTDVPVQGVKTETKAETRVRREEKAAEDNETSTNTLFVSNLS